MEKDFQEKRKLFQFTIVSQNEIDSHNTVVWNVTETQMQLIDRCN